MTIFQTNFIDISPFKKLKFKFQQKKLPKTLHIYYKNKLLICFDFYPSAFSYFAQKEFIRDAALIDLLISIGIRIGEAVAITLNDIVTSETTLLIHGKG